MKIYMYSFVLIYHYLIYTCIGIALYIWAYLYLVNSTLYTLQLYTLQLYTLHSTTLQLYNSTNFYYLSNRIIYSPLAQLYIYTIIYLYNC